MLLFQICISIKVPNIKENKFFGKHTFFPPVLDIVLKATYSSTKIIQARHLILFYFAEVKQELFRL